MKKGKVEDKIVDVITHEEYVKNPNKYDPDVTVIEDNSILYPIRKSDPRGNDNRAGYYNNGSFGYFSVPADELVEEYTENNKNIIDFNDSDGIIDMIEKSSNLKKMEEEILTTPDNIFQPKIGPKDTPIMRGMKQAIVNKKIDIDKYKHRVAQFVNDKRLFKGNDMTYKKSNMWMNALDLKATLIIEDKNPDVPNPMGNKIIIPLNSEEGADIYEK